ncbi:MAG: hypothetical protein IBJ16_14300 [Chitinophagaceae bacterium]|nr:hypothetical protein [Chitinophagaceae bacterium]
MNTVRKTILGLMMIAGTASIIVACSKGGDSPSTGGNPPGNTCDPKIITILLPGSNGTRWNCGVLTRTS